MGERTSQLELELKPEIYEQVLYTRTLEKVADAGGSQIESREKAGLGVIAASRFNRTEKP